MSEARFWGLVRRLADRVGVPMPGRPLVTGWFGVLFGLYSSPGRYYHDEDHVADLLRRLDALMSPTVGDPEAVEFAIWFHDVIYDPRSKGNEQRSADLFDTFMSTTGLDAGEIGRLFQRDVHGAILATTHDGRDLGGSFDRRPQTTAMRMVDLDLAGFADPWEVFDAKNALIRKEYAFVPEDQYRAGRAAFLLNLTSRPKIYWILTDLEAPTRENIKRHVRELLGA